MSCHDMMLARKKKNAAAKKAKALAAGVTTPNTNTIVNGNGHISHSSSTSSIHRPEHTRAHSHSHRLSYLYNKDKSLPSIPSESNPSASVSSSNPPPPIPFHQAQQPRHSHQLSSSSSLSSLQEAITGQKKSSSTSTSLHRNSNQRPTSVLSTPLSEETSKPISNTNPGVDLEDFFSTSADSGFLPIKLDMSSIPSSTDTSSNRPVSSDILSRKNALANRRSIFPTKSSSSSTSGSDTASLTNVVLSLDEPDKPYRSVEGYQEPPNGSLSPRNAIYLSDSNLPSSWSLGDYTTDDTENTATTSPELPSPGANPSFTSRKSEEESRQSRSTLRPDAIIPDRSILRSISPRPPINGSRSRNGSPSLPPFASNRSISPVNIKNGSLQSRNEAPITPKSSGAYSDVLSSPAELYENLSNTLRNSAGAPRLSYNKLSPGPSSSPLVSSSEDYRAIESVIPPMPTALLSPPVNPAHRRSISDTRHSTRNSSTGLQAAADITSPLANNDTVENSGSTSVLVSSSSNVDSLTRELIEANKKIAELERLLKEKDEAANTTPNLQNLESDIQEKRKTIAGLEAHGELVRKEIMVLENVKDGGSVESPSQLIDEFSTEMATMRSSLMAEITDLVIQRDNLKNENSKLTIIRDKAVEESSILNIKNSQLADMNNELSKQMIDKFGPVAFSQSKSDGGALLHKLAGTSSTSNIRRKEVAPLSPSKNARVEVTTKDKDTGHSLDEPMVTILDAGQVIDTRKDRQHARRFWKRPGAAVAKGLNKVFANDFEAGPEFYDNVNEYNQQGHAINTNGHAKNSRNGWFKNNDSNGGGSAIAAVALAATATLNHPTVSNNMPRGGSTSSLSSASTVVGNANNINNASTQTAKKESTLMGIAIEWRVSHEGNRIPIIVTRCVEEIENRGMLFEGIYRKSGAKSQVTSIEEAFSKTYEGDFDEVLSGDISGVTSALKQYLRYLPVPLITFDAYEDFIQAAASENENDKIDKLRSVINSLPPSHHDCLEFIIRHLAKVTNYSSQNLMTTRNLAVVFAPTLARDKTGEREMLDMQARNDCVQLLIDKCDSIFTGF